MQITVFKPCHHHDDIKKKKKKKNKEIDIVKCRRPHLNESISLVYFLYPIYWRYVSIYVYLKIYLQCLLLLSLFAKWYFVRLFFRSFLTSFFFCCPSTIHFWWLRFPHFLILHVTFSPFVCWCIWYIYMYNNGFLCAFSHRAFVSALVASWKCLIIVSM